MCLDDREHRIVVKTLDTTKTVLFGAIEGPVRRAKVAIAANQSLLNSLAMVCAMMASLTLVRAFGHETLERDTITVPTPP